MDEGLLRRNLAGCQQMFDIGMIGCPEGHAIVTEAVQAAVAAMHPAHPPRLQQQHDGSAVRILFVDEARHLDHGVRFEEAGLQHLLRCIFGRGEMLEIGGRGMHHLLRRQGAARMSAHAVGQDGQGNAFDPSVWHDGDAILLFFTVALMLGDAGINRYRHNPP
jgi:hypothetical protein